MFHSNILIAYRRIDTIDRATLMKIYFLVRCNILSGFVYKANATGLLLLWKDSQSDLAFTELSITAICHVPSKWLGSDINL